MVLARRAFAERSKKFFVWPDRGPPRSYRLAVQMPEKVRLEMKALGIDMLYLFIVFLDMPCIKKAYGDK